VSCENRSVHVGQAVFRGFRALVFAVACVALSAVLHCFAGGHLFGLGTFAVTVGAVALAALPFGNRQRGPVGLGVACGIAQAGLHLWFTAASGHLEHLTPNAPMLLVHALAALVSSIWLARGEAAMAAFVDLLTLLLAPSLLVRLLEASGSPAPPRPAVAAAPAPNSRLELLASVASRRGPPAGALAR
jgi:hypothetical protein